MFDRILVALDGSEFAEAVLPYVKDLAAKHGSTVILLRAIPPLETLLAPTSIGVPMAQPVADFTEVLKAERDEARAYLDRVASELSSSGIDVRTEVYEGLAAEVICDRAGAHGVGLIALTTHGRGGLARLFVGSVADEVIRQSCGAILLVRPEQTRGKASK